MWFKRNEYQKNILNKTLRGINKPGRASQSLLVKPDELIKEKHAIINAATNKIRSLYHNELYQYIWLRARLNE
jgi:hypothetical protein